MPNGFGSSIAGPGIGGGGSEIAAVSVGIYADKSGLVIGFSDAKREATRATVELEHEGARAGDHYGKGLVGKVTEAGHELRHAAHRLIQTFTSTLLVGEVAYASFEFGKRIGEAVFEGSDPKVKETEDKLKRLDDRFKKLREGQIEDAGKALHKGGSPVDTTEVQEAQKELDKLDLKINKLQSRLAESRETLEKWKNSGLGIAHPEDIEERERDVAYWLKEVNDALARRATLQGLVNRVLREGNHLDKESADIAKDREATERRIAAQREVAASRTASDISRIRQLMELGNRQRYGPSPGFGIQRGGSSR